VVPARAEVISKMRDMEKKVRDEVVTGAGWSAGYGGTEGEEKDTEGMEKGARKQGGDGCKETSRMALKAFCTSAPTSHTL
jgi:hypothetical protein